MTPCVYGDPMNRLPPVVTLRPSTLADADVIAGWGSDDAFCRAADWTVGLPPDRLLAFHRRLVTDPPTGLLRLSVVHEVQVVGYVDLHGTDPGRRELGFLIGPRERWGRGFGLAAAQAGIRHGFDVLGLDEIWAEALDANRASVRILEKIGMTETGRGDDGHHLGRPTFHRQFRLARPVGFAHTPVWASNSATGTGV